MICSPRFPPKHDMTSIVYRACCASTVTPSYPNQITAIGELATLPLVVLVSFMAQPRLLFAMAKDGLLPHLFAEVDSRGTLFKGSLVRKEESQGTNHTCVFADFCHGCWLQRVSDGCLFPLFWLRFSNVFIVLSAICVSHAQSASGE